MLDKRYNTTQLFHRRSQEWDMEQIKNTIAKLFQNIDTLENWQFVKVNWYKEKKKKREELKKHIYRTLQVHINEMTQKNTIKKEHVYNIQIPELLQDQFFYIGGLLKTPIFQLFDLPIIYRKINEKYLLKFKNNIVSIIADINKENEFNVNVYLNHINFNKDIPLENIITAMYKKDEFLNFIDSLPNDNDIINSLVQRCLDLWKNNKETKLIEELGKYRKSNVSVTDNLKKGKSIIFALKNASVIDEYTKPFMKTNSPILELIYSISEGTRSDTDLDNKRIRFSEYILAELINAIFDMICILNDDKRVKFKIKTTILLDTCNVSSIVHHNFPYNPVGEIASLLQCTIIGPGSFKKENVPNHLKNLDDSHFRKICPADTPDRDGCGVILNLCSNTTVDEHGLFVDNDNDIICSYPITHVPFLANDDQTRLQMASGQLKQSILLDKASKPYVITGSESNFFEFSTFKQNAKLNGEVIFKSKDFIIIKYINDKIDIFKLSYRPMYLNSADFLYSDLKVGSKFKKGDTIVTSKFFKNDEIALGQNLLAGIAIWEGYNYEDGIVISESIVDKYTSIHTVEMSFDIEGGQILLSLLDDKYKPLPEIGDVVKKGDVYAKLKHIGQDGIESINIDPKNLHVPIDCEIINIEIYPNSWNKQISQFDNFIKTLINNQNSNIDEIRNQLKSYMTVEEIDNILNFYEISKLRVTDGPPPEKSSKYSEKGKNIKGVKIKITGIHKSKIAVGDKVANRHGSKGVIAKIIPENEMPILEDGRRLEIILNPLGIISRMNIGQLFELHSTETLHNLKETVKNSYLKYNKLNDKTIKLIETYYDILDITKEKWTSKHIINKFNKMFKTNPIQAIEDLQIIQPPFESIHPKDLEKVMNLTKSEYKQPLYDNNGKKCFKNDIAIGYMYFNKLIHRSEDKLISRSVGPYVNTTLQPVAGKRKHGGHRLGEMEIWAFLAQGADITLEEFLTTHSDSPGKKLKVLADILENTEMLIQNDAPDVPRTLSLMKAMLKTIGLELEDN